MNRYTVDLNAAERATLASLLNRALGFYSPDDARSLVERTVARVQRRAARKHPRAPQRPRPRRAVGQHARGRRARALQGNARDRARRAAHAAPPERARSTTAEVQGMPVTHSPHTCPHGRLLCAPCALDALSAPITWSVGDRCRVRGRLGTIKALQAHEHARIISPEQASADVHLDRDEQGHMGWICTLVDELEPA